MKVRTSTLLSMLAVAILVVVALPSCGGDDDPIDTTPSNNNNNNNNNNYNNKPNTDDPSDMQDMALKVGNTQSVINGVTYVDAQYRLTGGLIVSVGKVDGLGYITSIPKTGWTTSSAVNVGYGYVLYNEATENFCRMYVAGQDGEGYHVNYQIPFKGVEKELTLSNNEVNFPAEGGTQELTIANSSIVPFTVSSSEEWCEVEKIQPGTGVKITCKPTRIGKVSTATIMLKQTLNDKTITINVKREGITHNAINLGLSVQWCDRYLGAISPESIGGYFAWGETTTKDADYYWSSYAYGSNENSVTNIGTNISGTQYDAATVSLGEDWRMPTRAEFYELRNKCDWKSSTVNGVKGVTATAPNGKSIFFAEGGGEKKSANSAPLKVDDACVWLANQNQYRNSGADYFYFGEYQGGSINPVVGDSYGTDRCSGLQIRAVKGKPYSDPESNYTTSGTVNGHNYTDLGLSVKWATNNLGATNSWDYGTYFIWTSSRNDWGSSWRMPTKEEMDELLTCTIEWTIYHNTGGFRITGPSGKSIFLPAAGNNYIYPSYMDERADYWTSTTSGSSDAYSLIIDSDVLTYGHYYQSCRPERRIRSDYGYYTQLPIRLVTK